MLFTGLIDRVNKDVILYDLSPSTNSQKTVRDGCCWLRFRLSFQLVAIKYYDAKRIWRFDEDLSKVMRGYDWEIRNITPQDTDDPLTRPRRFGC